MSRTDEKIRKAKEAMESDLRHPWTTGELARLVNLSSSHLTKIFKAEVGRTPLQYLHELKLHAAYRLLTTEFLTIKEVMHRVGINNHSHFVKDFKQAYGVLPSKVERVETRPR